MSHTYGVALFEDPTQYKNGWAAIGGQVGSEPYSFSNTGDLSNDVVWLTNIDADTFFRAGLQKTPRFRHDHYLRTKVSSMILELGLKGVPLSEQAVVLANVFHNVMKVTEYHVGISGAPVNTLATGLKQVLQPEPELIQPEIKKASVKACQSFVQCMKPHETLSEDSVITSLTFYRQEYAKQMVSYGLPTGKWATPEANVLSKSNKELLDWACELERPTLVKVRIMRLDADVNHLLNYGSGAGVHVKKASNGRDWASLNQREWMTTPELKVIRNFADLIVEDILVGEGYKKNPVKLPEWGALSYSTGILSENLWVSLTKDLAGKNAKTPQSAWLHSLDRMHCFLAARKIEKANFATIHSYGYGRVTIAIPDNSFKMLSDLALRMRMIAPMSEQDDIQHRKPSSDAPPEEVLEVIMERRAYNLLEQQDRAAMQKAKETQEKLKSNVRLTF